MAEFLTMIQIGALPNWAWILLAAMSMYQMKQWYK